MLTRSLIHYLSFVFYKVGMAFPNMAKKREIENTTLHTRHKKALRLLPFVAFHTPF